MRSNDQLITTHDLAAFYGKKRVFENINMSIRQGEILALVGGSGCGKSTLLRQLALLLEPTKGDVTCFGTDAWSQSSEDLLAMRQKLGVMFQQGALFSDLTILGNVMFALTEHTSLSFTLARELALLKIKLVGLDASVATLYPSELSGGMRKRAAVARAIALDPQLLFLDEPHSGLDPISADAMDQLILQLRDLLNLTIVLVTHDMDSLWRLSDRIIFLADGNIAAEGAIEDLTKSQDPTVQPFFGNPRAQPRHTT